MVTRLEYYLCSSDNTPVSTVWVENPQDKYNVPNDNQITKVRHTLLWRGMSWVLSQRSGHPLTTIRFFHGTIPIKRIPGKIMIIGQWLINALLLYIQIQVINISKCIRDLMVSTRTFYTIPEAEFIYYTPGQPGVQPHRINPQQGITYTNTSSLSLPR